jgi:5-hydroxyisourate hydrolase
MSLSTHVLDATSGRPAAGLTVRWESRGDDGWTEAQVGETDDDGRLRGWQPGTGVHRLVFDTGAWFASTGTAGFYPEVAITFEVTAPDQHYHVPLLLSPFAYSTYRGS